MLLLYFHELVKAGKLNEGIVRNHPDFMIGQAMDAV